MAGRLRLDRRRDLAAQLGRQRAAPGEGAADDRLAQARHQAGDLRQPAAPAVAAATTRASAPSPAARACRDAADGRRSRRTGASSTLRPAYITTTRSAISATTPRSCVISMIAEPSRVFRSRIRSRICAWIVTSSAVVGSSAISSFGLQASAMAIITRWRMPPESWCGYSRTRRAGAGMPTSVSISIALALGVARRHALVQPQRLADLLADGQHRVQAGHRLLEDHRDRVAADVAHLRLRTASAGRGRRSGCDPAILPGGSGISRRIDSAVTDLPQPDSPTMPSVSPASMWNDTPSTARTTPSGVPKCVCRFVDFQQRHARQSRLASRGSSASRSPSPSRFTASTVTREEDRREEHDVRLDLPERAALGHDVAPARDGRRRAGADERQDRLGDHRRGADERRLAPSAAPACWAGCGAR